MVMYDSSANCIITIVLIGWFVDFKDFSEWECV